MDENETLADALKRVELVWGSPGDIELVSDGVGEFASVYKLTDRGVQTIIKTVEEAAKDND